MALYQHAADWDDFTRRLDDDLLGTGLVDSLGVMRIVQFLDQEHGVRVQPADITLENFLTVRRIAAYANTLPTAGATQPAGSR